jgi:hypothetical protein
MITLTQQTSEQNTLTQYHYDMVTMSEVKKVHLACQLERLEIEMQQPTKDWDKIAFLKTDIATLKNYLKIKNVVVQEKMYTEKEMLDYGRFCVQCEKQGFIIPKN